MQALRAYLDESGLGTGQTDQTPAGFVYAAAGFIATEDDWSSLSDRWTGVLRDAGVDPPELHMREFGNPRGPFRDWRQTRIDALLVSLIRVINEMGAFGHSCIIGRGTDADWNQSYTGHVLSREDACHSSGMLRCIFELAKKAPAFVGADKRVDFICGRTGKWDGSVRRLFNTAKENMPSEFGDRRWLDSLTFDDPRTVPPLQVADLLAYESRRKFADYKDDGKSSFRRPITQLDHGGRITYCGHEKVGMEPIFERVLTDPTYRTEMERQMAVKRALEEKRRAKLRSKRRTSSGLDPKASPGKNAHSP